MDAAATAAGFSERTAYKWLRRHREGGAVLADRSSRPRRPTRKTEPGRESVVLKLRGLRMTGPVIAHWLGMPRSTVSRILRRHGEARLRPVAPPEPVRRYQRNRPGDLTTRVRGIGWEFVHVCIDDVTRLMGLRGDLPSLATARERLAALAESRPIMKFT